MHTLVLGMWLSCSMAGIPETRLIIDNRAGKDVDWERIGRLMRLVEQEPGDRTSLTVRVHVWPRTDILEVSATGSDTFFIAPCDIYMPEVDYQSILQGVLMAAYPDAAAQEIERRSRWIWFNERYVVGTPLERAAFP